MSKHKLTPRPDGVVAGSMTTIGVAIPWLVLIWWGRAGWLAWACLFLVWGIVLVGLCLKMPQSYGRRVNR